MNSSDIDKIFQTKPPVMMEDEVIKYYENLYKEKLKSEYQRIYHKGVEYGKRVERSKKEKGVTISRLAKQLNVCVPTLHSDIRKMGLGPAIRKRVLLEAVKKMTEVVE